MHARHWVFNLLSATMLIAFLVGCSSGPVRRVSEPSLRIQQLTVLADGSWSAELRVENFSSIPMRFDSLDLGLQIGGHAAGTLTARPAVSVGPESADVVSATLQPSLEAKLAVADALAAGRGVAYELKGPVTATPEERRQRTFQIERSSELSPAPGLPGVLR
ncbi:MAG: hypothetical protein M3Q42_06960 [Pseudomonadota bacterium]|nr:hypothetical protein [Pseudomonadota bacterium]